MRSEHRETIYLTPGRWWEMRSADENRSTDRSFSFKAEYTNHDTIAI